MFDYNQLKKAYKKSPYLIKKIYSYIPWNIRMGSEYRKTINFLEKSQYWSSNQWENYQTKELNKLLKYCYNYVPYYKQLFNKHNIDIESINIWQEFKKIPFMTKETVRENFELLISKEFNKKNLYEASTGGTTGKPLKLFFTKESYKKEWAFQIFFWNLAINHKPSDKKATFRGVQLGDTLYYKNPIYNEIRFSPFKLNDDFINEIINKLNDYNPKYIYGYPSAINLLAKYYNNHDYKIPDIKGVILISENIYKEQKKYIRDTFNAPVYSFYGHTERLILASMCEELSDYHPHPAYGVTELIDKNGGAINDGLTDELGELVGTGFINKAMPLLRYKTGDYAVWSDNKCNCERNFASIKNIKGRWDQEKLIGSNGTEISLTALNMHSDIYNNVKRLQFLQDEKGIVQLNIVKDSNYTKKDENKIKNQLLSKLGNEFNLEFNYLKRLNLTQSGKSKYLIQNIKQ